MRPDLWSILEPISVDPRVKSWKDVLRNLVFHAGKEGESSPTMETIRQETGYKSKRAVLDALSALEHHRIIRRLVNGRGRGTKTSYILQFDERALGVLKQPVDSVDNLSNGEVSSPLLSTIKNNGEVTSKNEVKKEVKMEVTSPLNRNMEVTSPIIPNNGEVTSIPPTPPYIGQSTSSSIYAGNGEVASPFVDNSAEDTADKHQTRHAEKPLRGGNDGKGRGPSRTGVMALLDRQPVDYLALCKKPGWRPNDPKQTPSSDLHEAKRAVIACAYRSGCTTDKANEFWHYNAVRKWHAIDCGSTIAELAFAFVERWKRERPPEFFAEQQRRKRAAANRVLS